MAFAGLARRVLSAAPCRWPLALQRRRGAGVILVYHRVGPAHDPCYQPLHPEQFDGHLRFLKEHFTVVRLSELLRRHAAGGPLAGLCAVTFDDGYRDFLDHAYPALRRHSVPATHYLVTDCLRDGRPNWNYRLNRVLLYGPEGGGGRPEGPDWPEILRVTAELARMRPEDREAWIALREPGVAGAPPPPPMLRVADLGRFDPDLIDWGSHGVTHASLGSCDAESARRELAESRRLLEEYTGGPVLTHSYPNGSYSPEVMDAARLCGYEAALRVDQAEVMAGDPRFALPRIDAGGTPADLLGLEVGGLIQAFRRLRSRASGAAPAGVRHRERAET